MCCESSGASHRCALCGGLFPDAEVDHVDDGYGSVTVCHDCVDRAAEPAPPVPWAYDYEPEPDDVDLGAHEWLNVTIANDRFDVGEAA